MTNDFDKNRYIHLKNFLDLINCKELTQELNNYIERGETVKDDQCPISECIQSTPTFDKLLEDLLPHFENICGKRLYPTYSYARLYKPGEELKKHTDRPSCEISATVTLGFEGNPWSIYMAGNKVDMQVGDAVLYRGMEVEHWREKYTEGQWQAQVFLHYVNADGPYADYKYDKRERLSHHTDEITDYAIFPKHLTNNFCDNIIKTYISDNIQKELPYINKDTNTLNTNIRDVSRVLISVNTGVGSTLVASALNANHNWWKYNVTHAYQAEFLIYKPNNHYVAHVDTVHEHNADTRKLTALAFLNDDFEGGKFFIQTAHNKVYPPQTKGTVLVFPGYMLHGVEPVTKGIRYSCVSWLLGPYFK